MSDMAFEMYAQQIDFLPTFQLEILQKKIADILQSKKRKRADSDANDIALFEHFSGLGAGIDADSAKSAYFEAKYGSADFCIVNHGLKLQKRF